MPELIRINIDRHGLCTFSQRFGKKHVAIQPWGKLFLPLITFGEIAALSFANYYRFTNTVFIGEN